MTFASKWVKIDLIKLLEEKVTLEVVNPDGTREPAIRKLTKEEHEIFAGAVIKAASTLPVWRDAIALMRPFFDASCNTAYTDRYSRVGLSRWFFEELDVIQRSSVLLHEASHVLYNCFVRGEAMGADPTKNNLASDLEINSGLATVPNVDLSFGILPEKDPFNFDKHLTQEQYYHLIDQMNYEPPKQEGQQGQPDPNCPEHGDNAGQGDQSGDQGGQDGDQSGDGGNGDQPGENGQGDGDGQGQGQGQGNGNGNGSGQGQGQGNPSGNHQHGNSGPQCTCPHTGDGKGNNGSIGCDQSTDERVADADDLGIERASDAEQSIAKKNTAARVEEAAKKARQAGDGHMSQFLELAAKRLSPPRVNWRTIFRRVLSKNNEAIIRGRSDYSYRRTSRRLTDSPYIFPGMVKYQPKTMFGIDTSGSMSHEDYMRSITEVEGILKAVGRSKGAMRVFSVDTQVANVKPVDSVAKVNLMGGGGTDMAVAFLYVNSLAQADRPDIFVLATDGHTDWSRVERAIHEAPKKYPSIILVTTASGYATVTDSLKRLTTVIDVSDGEN